jgi:hypothetical protein
MITEKQIQEILLGLKELLERIDLLRQKSVDIEQGLTETKRRYDERLGDLNAEEERLRVLSYSLRARLQEKPVNNSLTTTYSPPDMFSPEPVEPPPPVGPDPSLQNLYSKSDEIRRHRKQKIADHIYYFIDPSQENVLKVINSMLVSESADVGEMLERIIWGPIWSERADWETLDDQYQRLSEWQQSLRDRMTYREAIIYNLERDTCYALWLEWIKGEDQWNQFLEELVRKQQAENERLIHEVSVLEAELQSRQLE